MQLNVTTDYAIRTVYIWGNVKRLLPLQRYRMKWEFQEDILRKCFQN